MILIHLNENSGTPKYRQIMNQLIDMIDTCVLQEGEQLPASRILADKLNVNRSTVYKAYQELWSLGYINSRPGSYSTVRKPLNIASNQNRHKNGFLNWDEISDSSSNRLISKVKEHQQTLSSDVKLNFRSLSPDPTLLPTERFRKCLNRVLMQKGSSLLGYGDPKGYMPLREYIAEQMRKHCIDVSSNEILITGGSQNSMDLIFRLLVSRSSKVVLESPTYSSMIPLLRYYTSNIISIPMNHAGMDLNLLERNIKSESPVLVYTMPTFHNPTGITTAQQHREELLKLCQDAKIPVVEDAFEEEMKYFGRTVLPLKAMDHMGFVLYLGTFSKVLFPGMRIGWIVADRDCIDKLSYLKHAGDISGNILNQAALTRFCRSGYYDLHIKHVHTIYRRRMKTALNAMKRYFTHKLISYTKPMGGYTIWVEIKNPHVSENELVKLIEQEGISISPGSIHYHDSVQPCSFRISIAHRNESEIHQGLKRIGPVVCELVDRCGHI